jgi:hypothetical protein
MPPIVPTYPLDTGIRPESNTCSGGPCGVPDSEVNAHLGNLRLMLSLVTQAQHHGIAVQLSAPSGFALLD